MKAPRRDDSLRRRNLRLALALGLGAVAVYAVFFVIKALGAGGT